MVEAYSYMHPAYDWEMSKWRVDDKDLGQVYSFEFGTLTTLKYVSFPQMIANSYCNIAFVIVKSNA